MRRCSIVSNSSVNRSVWGYQFLPDPNCSHGQQEHKTPVKIREGDPGEFISSHQETRSPTESKARRKEITKRLSHQLKHVEQFIIRVEIQNPIYNFFTCYLIQKDI